MEATNKKLKTLEQHNEEKLKFYQPKHTYNGIACPQCGEELTDTNPQVILSSYPPQKRINCIKCSYTGYRIA